MLHIIMEVLKNNSYTHVEHLDEVMTIDEFSSRYGEDYPATLDCSGYTMDLVIVDSETGEFLGKVR